MGEAIARFREVALAIRCRSDAAFIAPDHLFCGPVESLRGLGQRLLEGSISPLDFAAILRDAAKQGHGIKGGPSARDLLDPDRASMARYLSQYRRPILAKAPSNGELHKQHAAALREAVEWGSLLPSIEKRLDALTEATLSMREMAGDAWLARYSRTKERYAKALLRWQRAFDALARFLEPPAVAATSEKQSGRSRSRGGRGRQGIGGRKKKYPERFVREVLTARGREEKACRRAKERLPSKVEWLRIYCRNRGIDTATMFPSENEAAPEPWDVRANRFWKAAAAQVKRAGN